MRFASYALLLAVLVPACKSTQKTSEVKSLDNLARSADADFRRNLCGTNDPDQAGDLDIPAAKKKLLDELVADAGFVSVDMKGDAQRAREELKASLVAVPFAALVGFFDSGGAIVVSDTTKEECGKRPAKFKDSDEDAFVTDRGQIEGFCWRDVAAEELSFEGKNVRPVKQVIYLSGAEGSLSHQTVRAFGYIVSQHLTKLAVPSDVDVSEGDRQFESRTSELARTFMRELATVSATENSRYDMKALESYALKVEPDGDAPELLRDFVFAEAFDSFYCNADTREIMAKDFPETNAAFTPFVKDLEALATQFPEVQDETDLTKLAQEIDQTAGENQGASLRGGILRGIVGGIARPFARLAVGIGRGIVHTGVAVGRVAVGVARAGVRVGVALVRGGAAVIRGGARIVAATVRATGRLAVGIVRVGAHAVGSVARATVNVASWIIAGTSRIVHGLAGPYLHMAGCPAYQCGGAFGLSEGQGTTASGTDYDGDGVANAADQCWNTPGSEELKPSIHSSGEWAGCAPGQMRDKDVSDSLLGGYDSNADMDGDGLAGEDDFCSNTPNVGDVRKQLAKSGEWQGCIPGQTRDADLLKTLPGAEAQAG